MLYYFFLLILSEFWAVFVQIMTNTFWKSFGYPEKILQAVWSVPTLRSIGSSNMFFLKRSRFLSALLQLWVEYFVFRFASFYQGFQYFVSEILIVHKVV